MKLNKFFWSFATIAALGLASCSSDNLSPDEPNAPVLPGFNEDGEGYLAISLNLPTTASTGARSETNDATDSSNDQFNDGIAAEYAVKSAMLLIFTGATEAAAVYEGAYDLSGYTIIPSSNTNVTETVQKLVKVKGNKTSDSNFWALAVLNYNGTTSISLSTDEVLTIKNLGTTEMAVTKGSTKFTDISRLLLPSPTSGLHGEYGFLMTNAIIADNGGNTSGISVSTLVKVTDNIKTNEADALANAAEIYVERVSAKVNLSTTGNNNEITWDSGTAKPQEPSYELGTDLGAGMGSGLGTNPTDYASIKAVVKQWGLGNVNSRAYLTRQWQSGTITDTNPDWLTLRNNGYTGTNTYRFVGLVENPYRTYWGEDPNYDGNSNLIGTGHPADTKNNIEADPTVLSTDIAAPQYCLENTFKLEAQKIQNTTCAVIAVEFQLDGTDVSDFYIIGDNKNLLYNEENIKKYLAHKAIQEYGDKIIALFPGKTKDEIKYLNATISSEAGQVSLTNVTFCLKSNEATTAVLNNTSAGVSETIWNKFFDGQRVTKYSQGIAYYRVPIMHFGQTLCPWQNSDAKGTNSYAKTTENDYNYANWLGRYGIVRNNWYQLDISAIKGIGEATPPNLETDDDWDDEVYSYLALKINVLSWAQRKQSVTLQ